MSDHHRPTPELSSIIRRLRVEPGTKVTLPGGFDPAWNGSFTSTADAERALVETTALLSDYQARLAAAGSAGLLIIIQGLDASGKDGVIKHVMSGVNPAGVAVFGFKVPTSEELGHDYLWRYQQHLPTRGQIVIFNRSQYEEVLVVRVHPENLRRQHLPSVDVDSVVWKRRFREINEWEHHLTDTGFHVVKIFLNVSKDEQRKRFLDRIDHPEKNWKFSVNDIEERQFWDQYTAAFSDMLSNTSTPWAPWYVVPADHKWFARLAVAAIIVDELKRIDPAFPTLSPEATRALSEARQRLIAEGPAALPPAGDAGLN